MKECVRHRLHRKTVQQRHGYEPGRQISHCPLVRDRLERIHEQNQDSPDRDQALQLDGIQAHHGVVLPLLAVSADAAFASLPVDKRLTMDVATLCLMMSVSSRG